MITDQEKQEKKERVKELKQKLHIKYMISLEEYYKSKEYLSKDNKKDFSKIYTENKKK